MVDRSAHRFLATARNWIEADALHGFSPGLVGIQFRPPSLPLGIIGDKRVFRGDRFATSRPVSGKLEGHQTRVVEAIRGQFRHGRGHRVEPPRLRRGISEQLGLVLREQDAVAGGVGGIPRTHRNACQGGTTVEAWQGDVGDAGGNGDAGQVGAAVEGAWTNARHGVSSQRGRDGDGAPRRGGDGWRVGSAATQFGLAVGYGVSPRNAVDGFRGGKGGQSGEKKQRKEKKADKAREKAAAMGRATTGYGAGKKRGGWARPRRGLAKADGAKGEKRWRHGEVLERVVTRLL